MHRKILRLYYPLINSEKKTVKGNVMDEYGQPLVGVAVQVKGTSLGVVTDLDGNFSFSIPVDSRALLFSIWE